MPFSEANVHDSIHEASPEQAVPYLLQPIFQRMILRTFGKPMVSRTPRKLPGAENHYGRGGDSSVKTRSEYPRSYLRTPSGRKDSKHQPENWIDLIGDQTNRSGWSKNLAYPSWQLSQRLMFRHKHITKTDISRRPDSWIPGAQQSLSHFSLIPPLDEEKGHCNPLE